MFSPHVSMCYVVGVQLSYWRSQGSESPLQSPWPPSPPACPSPGLGRKTKRETESHRPHPAVSHTPVQMPANTATTPKTRWQLLLSQSTSARGLILLYRLKLVQIYYRSSKHNDHKLTFLYDNNFIYKTLILRCGMWILTLLSCYLYYS